MVHVESGFYKESTFFLVRRYFVFLSVGWVRSRVVKCVPHWVFFLHWICSLIWLRHRNFEMSSKISDGVDCDSEVGLEVRMSEE